MNEDDIFAEALEIADRHQRDAFLDEACAGNDELRKSVDELLAMTDTGDDFLETPAMGPGEPLDDVKPGAIVDRYRLISRVGEGGFGEVWRAEQSEPVQRIVALKVIKPGMDTRQVIARFEAERQTLAMMNHRNIAAVLDAGSTDRGRPYFVMEFIDGLSIDEFCDQKRLPIVDRLTLFAQICRAVHHAHQKGVVHRDIKPSNIIVANGDTGADAKVIDFGISKAMVTPDGRDITATVSQQLMGTPEYMSPEQMAGDPDIDTRADVYALGGVLYKLLTGVAPLDAATLRRVGLDELARAIREDNAPRPSSRVLTVEGSDAIAEQRATLPLNLSRSLRGDLDWIVTKALEKERARRYESASELARDVERYLACEPVSATPPSLLYRTGKFIQRNTMAVLAASTVSLAVVAIAVLATVNYFELQAERDKTHDEWVRAERERQEAQEQRDIANKQRQLAETERARAEEQRQRAVDEADKAMQFAGMLEDLINAASPESGNPADRTLREQLDLFAASLSDQLEGRPDSEARLRRTIGQMYMSLREWSKAGTHLERALELRREALGNEHPDTIESLTDWGEWLFAQSRIDEAESAIQSALQVLRTGGPNEVFVKALDVLSKIRRLQSSPGESHELLHEAWKMSREVFGEDHPRTIRFQGSVAFSRLRQRESGEAETLARDALERMQAVAPDSHIGVAMAKHYLARVLLQTGDLEEAETLIREALDVHRRVAGDDSVVAVVDLVTLAKILRAGGRVDEAVATAREAVEIAERSQQEAESSRFHAYDLLSNLLRTTDQDESISVRLKAIEARRRLIPNHREIVTDLRQAAMQLRRSERYDEAEKCYRDVLQWLEERDHEPQPWTRTVHDLADLLREAGKPEEALKWFEKVSIEAERMLPLAMIDQIETLIEIDRLDEAQELAQKLSEFNSDQPMLQATATAVDAQLLTAENELVKARAKLNEAFDQLSQATRNPRLAERINVLLIDCDLQEENYESAETNLQAAYARIRRRRAFLTMDRRRTVRKLIQLYESWDRPEELEHWRKVLQGGDRG